MHIRRRNLCCRVTVRPALQDRSNALPVHPILAARQHLSAAQLSSPVNILPPSWQAPAGKDIRSLAPAAFDAESILLNALRERFRKALERFLSEQPASGDSDDMPQRFSGSWTVLEKLRFSELVAAHNPRTNAEWQALADELRTGRGAEIHKRRWYTPRVPALRSPQNFPLAHSPGYLRSTDQAKCADTMRDPSLGERYGKARKIDHATDCNELQRQILTLEREVAHLRAARGGRVSVDVATQTDVVADSSVTSAPAAHPAPTVPVAPTLPDAAHASITAAGKPGHPELVVLAPTAAAPGTSLARQELPRNSLNPSAAASAGRRLSQQRRAAPTLCLVDEPVGVGGELPHMYMCGAAEPPPAAAAFAEADAFEAFLLGDTSACRSNSKLSRACAQISLRRVEACEDREAEGGWGGVRTLIDIEPNGFIFVYGGKYCGTANDCEARAAASPAITFQGSTIDAHFVRELPPTHWGALPSTSSTANARRVMTAYDTLRNVVLIQARSRGLRAGELITVDYPLPQHDFVSVPA